MRGMGSLAALLTALALAPAASAQQAPDLGGFHSVLGVGQGQTVNAGDLASYEASGTVPGSFVNQLQMYSGVSRVASTLTASTLGLGWKDSGFRPQSAPGAVETPRPGVTIVRDPVYRVPRIYGVTRSDTMFGAGYATAEDRLFLMDALRHTAEASTVELLGASAAPADADAITHQDFSPDELQRQFDALPSLGPEAAQGRQDVLDYIAGINAYIDAAQRDPSKMPAEYPALGVTPKPWTVPDTASLAIFLIAQFTSNGGSEDKTAQLLADFQQRFGRRLARARYEDFRRADDPEAPTVSHVPFRSDRPGRIDPAAVAMPDAGSIVKRNALVAAPSTSPSTVPSWAQDLVGGLPLPHHASNALLVDARHSVDGRPLAAMGPQVGYYSPEIFNEYELHGPGIDVSGVSFPGASPYPLIGHGRDFAWTGTTPNGDTVDTFAEKLCEPDGSTPSFKSTHYLYKNRCIPFTTRDQTMTTPVSPLSPGTPPQTVTLRAMRSVHGPVTEFATVGGDPVALTESHATAFHELRSLLAFKGLAENQPTDGRSFQAVMRNFVGMENWFYVGRKDIAWLQSGWFPRHARGVDLDLPIWGTGRYDWRNFDPATFDYTRLPDSANPRAVNPKWGYLASWNNKEARGWRAPPGTWSFGPIQRVQLLERPLRIALKQHGKVDLPTLARISVRAATADLRATEAWSWMRRVIGRPPADLAAAVGTLDAWAKAGGQRRDLNGDNVDEDSPAIVLMDTWWPIAVRRMFEPALGGKLVDAITQIVNPFREEFFFDGWWGYVQKDLRRVLHRPERGRLSSAYCGGGSLTRCRAILVGALRDAIAQASKDQGTSDMSAWKHVATCPKTNPPSCDQIVPVTAGAVDTPPFPFHNRGTFHQLAEVGG